MLEDSVSRASRPRSGPEEDRGTDSFTFVVSTAQVDRAGDQIDQNGWDLEGYTRNPVVLLSHA